MGMKELKLDAREENTVVYIYIGLKTIFLHPLS